MDSHGLPHAASPYCGEREGLARPCSDYAPYKFRSFKKVRRFVPTDGGRKKKWEAGELSVYFLVFQNPHFLGPKNNMMVLVGFVVY